MAQDTTPAIVVYRGNGDNSVPYDVRFDKGYYGEIKVLFIRRGLADYTYNPDPSNYTVNGRLYGWINGTTYIYTHTPNPAVGADTTKVKLYAWKAADESKTYTTTSAPSVGDATYDSAGVVSADTVSAVTNNSITVNGVDYLRDITSNVFYTVTAIAGQTITVDSVVYSRAVQHDIANQLQLYWTGTTLTSDDFICIARETERGQPYEYPNNQKHIEYALDNLERQIQEVANKADNALLVDPSWLTDPSKMNPIDWLKSIIRCMDFSVRALRYASGWLDYSLDDPNIADGDKTWYHLLNTDNIKSVRERKEIVDGAEHRWVEYLDQNGNWNTMSDSAWEGRIEEAERIANEAHDIAEQALIEADGADSKSDQALDYAHQAFDAATSIFSERHVFVIAPGQTTLQFGEDVEDKEIDLYWNGVLITKTGNWTASGDTITMLFGPEDGDTIVVFLNVIRQVVNTASLDAHNIDLSAHANLFNYIDCGTLS